MSIYILKSIMNKCTKIQHLDILHYVSIIIYFGHCYEQVHKELTIRCLWTFFSILVQDSCTQFWILVQNFCSEFLFRNQNSCSEIRILVQISEFRILVQNWEFFLKFFVHKSCAEFKLWILVQNSWLWSVLAFLIRIQNSCSERIRKGCVISKYKLQSVSP